MKVLLRTYGCRANHYDTETLRATLAAAGIDEATSAGDAEVAVFNSCTVTAAAEADLRAGIRAAARENPAIRTIVMGCAAAAPARDERTAPLATLPRVETVVAGADVETVAIAIGVKHGMRRAVVQSTARAHLRIQDGCDEHCTFCATTIARGAARSRETAAIVDEARVLAETHPEVVITGVHIGAFGSDSGSSLGALVETLVTKVPEVRFRLSSLEATEIDDRLGEILRAEPFRLAPYLHAPLQSGSNAILRRMGRHWYDAASYEARIREITTGVRTFGLSADVIAGFPGETEEDHDATVQLVKRLPFTDLHVFTYSPRPGTAALRMNGHVPNGIARARAAHLRELAAEKALAYTAFRDGGTCDVAVTERGRGLTEDYLSVSISDHTIPRRTRFKGTLRAANGKLTAFPDE